ncbi:MAG: hypothetical protein FWG74_04205 [Planctomycetes bacterium]|nr:hypothetical protein [Planctomycetota bacterium]
MADMNALQSVLTSAGKNYLRLDNAEGNVRTATSGIFSRWLARIPTAGAKEQNRATIDSLVGKLRGVEGYGDQLAGLVQGRLAALRQSGRPLSGRQAAEVISQAGNEARQAYIKSSLPALADRHLGKLESMFGEPAGSFTSLRGQIVSDAEKILAARGVNAGAAPGAVEQAFLEAFMDCLLRDGFHTQDVMDMLVTAEKELGRGYSPHLTNEDVLPLMRAEIKKAVLAGLAADLAAEQVIDKSGACVAACREVIRREYRGEFSRLAGPLLDASSSGTVFSSQALGAFRDRGLDGRITPDLLRGLGEGILAAMTDHFSGRTPLGLPPELELRTFRNQMINQAMGVYQEVKAEAGQALELLLSGHRTQGALEALEAFMAGGMARLKASGAEPELFFRAAVSAVLDAWSNVMTDSPVKVLATPGSSLFDAVYQLGKREELAAPSRILMDALREKAELLEENEKTRKINLGMLEPSDLMTIPLISSSFRWPVDPSRLSLGFQRKEILPPGEFIAGGPLTSRSGRTTPDNGMVQGARDAWQQELRPKISDMFLFQRGSVPYPPGPQDPNAPEWGASIQFDKDVVRTPVLVNGTAVRTTDAFMALFPDRRTASLISRALHQSLILAVPPSAPQAIKDTLYERLLDAENVVTVGGLYPRSQLPSVTALEDGSYRLRYEMNHVYNDKPFTTDAGVYARPSMNIRSHGYAVEFVFDPRVAPSPGQPPAVSDVQVDLLVRTL